MTKYRNFLENVGSIYNLPEVKVVPLDAVVINRADLRGVQEIAGKVRAYPDAEDYTVGTHGWHEAQAREHLSLAEHLRANPPVDEAQVNEMRRDLRELESSWGLPEHLVKKGWRKEASES